MTEEENASVEDQSSQEVAQPAEAENVQERQESPESAKARNGAEYNWAETRRQLKEQERQIRERDEYIARIKGQEQASSKEEEINLSEDDLPTYGHVKKAWKKGKKEMVDEIRREVRAEIAQSTLKLRYPDYDDIVTSENIEILKNQKPELAATLASASDPYAQAVAVYDALKMIGADVPKRNSLEKEKALKNAQKPLSVNAVAKQSAIGQAHIFENGLTPELKKQLRKEMEDARRRA